MVNQLLPFENSHIDLIDLREGQNIEDYKERISTYTTLGLGYTLVVDNKIICCSGVISPYPNVAECWLVAGKDFEKHGMIIGRTIKSFLAWVQPFYHRFQMSVEEGFTEAERFAEFLGFEKEGVMKMFDTKGRDFILYARVK